MSSLDDPNGGAGCASTAAVINLNPPRALSITDFCRLYGIGRTHAYAEISGGRLHARKAGRRTLITVDAAEAWLEQLPELSGNRERFRRGGEA